MAAVDDLRWGASPNGSIAHLVDVRGVPYCGHTFPDEPEITTGYLPAWKWWGYLVCVDCPHHVELDEHEIAAPRRPLAADELPTPRPCGRHAIETLDAPPHDVPGRCYRPGTPAPDPTQPAAPRHAA